jgi:signal transduction histidine kinase
MSTPPNQMQRRIRGLVGERTRLLAATTHDLRTYLTRMRLRAEFALPGSRWRLRVMRRQHRWTTTGRESRRATLRG